ncbi:MAG: 30S ribosomal protein S7 [Dehalococcoidia bacterium]|jgi:small subunit ribosomal protein S7
MARRSKSVKRTVLPDARYHSVTVTKIITRVMESGKKTTSERIIYGAMNIIAEQEKGDPVAVLDLALKNAVPLLEVKPRRVGGATYQVPIEVKQDRGFALAIRWMLKAAAARSGRSMAEKLAAELIDASKKQGATIKKREDTHKMAEANRAFVHYRW